MRLFSFFFCHPTLAHCNTKIGHFSALRVFHPHFCRSSNLKCDSQVASARPHIQGDGRHKRTLQTACFLRCRSRCLIHTNMCNVSTHTHTHIHPSPLLVIGVRTRMLSPVGQVGKCPHTHTTHMHTHRDTFTLKSPLQSLNNRALY